MQNEVMWTAGAIPEDYQELTQVEAYDARVLQEAELEQAGQDYADWMNTFPWDPFDEVLGG